MRMIDEESYCTLCEVVDKGGYRTLKAIQDLEDGEFIPPVVYSIFHPNLTIEEVGEIGLWQWWWTEEKSSYGKGKEYSEKSKELWIEYISLPKDAADHQLYYNRLVDLISTLKKDHDYFIGFEEDEQGNIHCIYCPSNGLEEKCGKLQIKSFILDVYEINESDIINYMDTTGKWIRFYQKNSVSDSVKIDQFEAFNLQEIIKKELNNHLKKYLADFEGITKEKRNELLQLINFVPCTSLGNEIIKKIGCSKERVESAINAFVESVDLKFENKDQETKLLSRMINNDTALYQEFCKKADEEWNAQNSHRMKESENKLQENENCVKELEKNKIEYEQCLTNLNSDIKAAQKRVHKLEEAEQNLIPQVQARIDEAHQDYSSFLGEYAFATALSGINTKTISSTEGGVTGILKGEALEAEECEEYEDLLSVLMEAFKTIGIREENTGSIAAYLVAAFYNKIPLILAGYGAEVIVDAFSATLAGQRADRYYATSRSSFDFVADGRITAVFNPFDTAGTFQYFTSQPTYCFYIIPTIEELVMEPRGIYDYALPLYTSPLFKAPAIPLYEAYYVGDNCEQEIQLSLQESGRSPVSLPGGVLSSFGNMCSDRLGKGYSRLYDPGVKNQGIRNSIITKDLFLLQIIPVLMATDQAQIIPDLIDDFKLSRERDVISRWCGGFDGE